MNQRKQNVKDILNGTATLPATFTTGYKRDLDLARRLVRERKKAREEVQHAPAPLSRSA